MEEIDLLAEQMETLEGLEGYRILDDFKIGVES